MEQQGGLLNFFQSPGGQGLLSAIAGYAAGARRGTPVNNIGRGLLSGVTGYQSALEEQKKTNQTKAMAQMLGFNYGSDGTFSSGKPQAPAGGKTFGASVPPVGVESALPAAEQNTEGFVGGQAPQSGTAQSMQPGSEVAPYPQNFGGGWKTPATNTGSRISQMTPEQIALVKLMGGPDLASLWIAARNPTELKAGSIMRNADGSEEFTPKVPDGWTLTPDRRLVPMREYGDYQVDLARRNADATEGVKYGYGRLAKQDDWNTDLVKVDLSDGTSRTVTKAQAAAMANGGGYNGQAPGAGGGYGQQSGGQGLYMGTPSPVSQEAQKQHNTIFMEDQYKPALAARTTAQSDLDMIKATREIGLKTGMWTGTKEQIASALASMGMEDAAEYASKVQQFQALATKRTISGIKALGANPTDRDMKALQQTWVDVQNTPEANAFIMDLAEAQANLAIDKANFFEKTSGHAAKQGNMTQVGIEWNKRKPSIWEDPVMEKWKQRQQYQSGRTGS